GQLTSYGYDSDQRLSEVELPGSSLRYQYDHQGNRISQSLNGQTTHWLVDANRDHAQVLEEQDATGQTTHYSHGDDLLSQQRGDDVRYFLYDALGSTRGLTDAQGNLTDQYQYDAWGQTRQHDGTSQTAYQFAGEQWDTNLGWIYLRARYLDPVTGRFVSVDPFNGYDTKPSSLHDYLYADNDPVVNLDPSGRETIAGLMTGTSNALAISNARIRSEFKKGARAGWRAAQEAGRLAETKVKQIVQQCLKMNRFLPGRIGKTRKSFDAVFEFEADIYRVEAKNKLPPVGSAALRRLGNQLEAAQNAGQLPHAIAFGQTFTRQRLAEVRKYFDKRGIETASIDFIGGFATFAGWLEEVYDVTCD
ncbi:RHS repeat-associated core domain-containing protein, partial [Chitinivorax sp. B]|uniref:RHS repeat domain-containing protein n=1 Tax=Chitinivorax sp. B TaxID=2502235 RepID=UPI0010F7D5EF